LPRTSAGTINLGTMAECVVGLALKIVISVVVERASGR
jgi:hypothetical protein